MPTVLTSPTTTTTTGMALAGSAGAATSPPLSASSPLSPSPTSPASSAATAHNPLAPPNSAALSPSISSSSASSASTSSAGSSPYASSRTLAAAALAAKKMPSLYKQPRDSPSSAAAVAAGAMGLPPPSIASSGSKRSADYSPTAGPGKISDRRSPNKKMPMDEEDDYRSPTALRNLRAASVRTDETMKWKKEAEKWQDQYERQMMAHRRDLALLEDKMTKLDGALQNALKEKNQVQVALIAKEKDVIELQHREQALKSNLAKSDKSSILFHDKANRALALEKKVSDLQKATGRIRSVADKKASAVDKLLKEREDLEALVETLKLQFEDLSAENGRQVRDLKEVEESKAILEGRMKELEELLEQSNESLKARDSNYQNQLRELEQREDSLRRDKSEMEVRLESVGRALTAAREERDADKQRIDQLMAKIESDGTKLAELTTITLKWNTERAAFEAKLNTLRQQLDSMTSMRDVSIKDLERIRALLSSSQTENTMLRDNVAEVLAEKQDLSLRLNQLEQLGNAQVQGYTEVIESLRAALALREKEAETDAASRAEQLHALTGHLQLAMEELQSRQLQIDAAVEERDALRAEVERLKLMLISTLEQESQWKERVKNLEDVKTDLEYAVNSLERDLLDAKTELSELRRMLSIVAERSTVLEVEVSRLTSELEHAQSELTNTLAEHQMIVEEQTARIEELTSQIDDDRKFRDGQSDMTELRIKKIEVEAEDRVAEHERRVVECEERVREVELLLKGKSIELEVVRESNRMELGQAKYSLVEAQDMLAEYRERVHDTDLELEEALALAESLKAKREADQIKFAADMAAAAEAQAAVVHGLQNRIKELQEKISFLEMSLPAPPSVDQAMQEELTRLRADATKLKLVEARLLEDLEASNKAVAIANAEVARLTTEMREGLDRVKSLEKENATYQQAIASLESALDSTRLDLQRMSEVSRISKAEMQTRFVEMSRSVTSLDAKLGEITVDLQAERSAIAKLHAELDDKTLQLNAAAEAHKAEVSSLTSSIKAKDAAIAELRSGTLSTEDKLAEIRKELADLESSLSEERQAHEATLSKAKELESLLDSERESRSPGRENRRSWRISVASTQATVVAPVEQEDLTRLRAELRKATSDLLEEKRSHSTTRARIERLERNISDGVVVDDVESDASAKYLQHRRSYELLERELGSITRRLEEEADAHDETRARLAEVLAQLEEEQEEHMQSRAKLEALEGSLALEMEAHLATQEETRNLRQSLESERKALEGARAEAEERRRSYSMHAAELKAKIAELAAALTAEMERGRAKDVQIAELTEAIAEAKEINGSAEACAEKPAEPNAGVLIRAVEERDERIRDLEQSVSKTVDDVRKKEQVIASMTAVLDGAHA
ncbi:hypothetical protein DFJ73DRAFT_481145 [Zopfochytrium polystomum]|nr:hypothetical protein DFJ73DRAFT_481145 [Zopfochytrium polystomum]